MGVSRPRPDVGEELGGAFAVQGPVGVRQDDPRQRTAVAKKYQRPGLDTSALTVPDQVSVAMGKIAAELREGRLVPFCR